MFHARPLTGPTKDRLFFQTAKGRAVLQQVKDFMRQYVLPAQVSSKSCQKQRGFVCIDEIFNLCTQQFVSSLKANKIESKNNVSPGYIKYAAYGHHHMAGLCSILT